MVYNEEDYLQLSGLQHFSFCRCQWALIHIEQQWTENLRTVDGRFPLHNLEQIVCFSYPGASPALMGACAERDIGLCFCTPRGKLLARSGGISRGNVLLRRTQYRYADDPTESVRIAQMMIFGKVHNARWSMERTRRDHKLRIDDVVFRMCQVMVPPHTGWVD